MNDLHALSGAYALDAVTDEERRAFEEHLADCADCRVEVAELQQTAAELAELAATPPPSAVREGVLGAIANVRPLPPLPPLPEQAPAPEPIAEPIPLAARRRRAPWLAAAAAVAVIGTGLAITQPWQDDDAPPAPALSAQVLEADDAEEVTLEFPDGARATLVRSASHGRAVLVTENMPGPPPGKDYQIWLETPAGSMIPAGVMPERPDQTVLLDGDASQATGAGITVEPDGGSPEPTSDPIALFRLT